MKLVDLIRSRSILRPDDKALIHLNGDQSLSCSFDMLNQQIERISKLLTHHAPKDAHVLLLFPAGVDFVESLIACWQSSMVAVALPCPEDGEFSPHLSLIQAVIEDAAIDVILTLDSHIETLSQLIDAPVAASESNTGLLVMKTRKKQKSDAVYLQYTSGSTAAPKAAMLTRENLEHSIEATIKAWHYQQDSRTLCFAPHTHIYGLVCGILVPLYHGTPAYLMSTKSFIESPIRWLEAISEQQITHSGCPDFAYQLCVNRISKEEAKGLNLSAWQVAINGGDMVRPATIELFCQRFSPMAFDLLLFAVPMACRSYQV